MEILFFIMCLVFWGYVAIVVAKYGILPSLSDSYYKLPLKYRDIIFTFVFWISGILAAILGQSALMFLAGAGICFVGTAPQFKESFIKPVHFAGAFSAAIFSQLYIFLVLGIWPLNVSFLFICAGIILMKAKNRTWWLEMASFVSAFMALAIN